MWNNSLCELWNLMLAHQVKWNKSLCAAAHFTLRSNISLPKAISQIPQGIYFVEKAECFRTRLFLAGALGLEPRAYGFGDRRSTNWAIPLYVFQRRRPYFKWWAFRDSNPGLSGYEPEALTNWAKGPYDIITQGVITRSIVPSKCSSVKSFLRFPGRKSTPPFSK